MRAVLVRIEHEFDVALSRSFEPCKPHPAPLLHILERVGASPKEAAMVGDSVDDMDCGNGEARLPGLGIGRCARMPSGATQATRGQRLLLFCEPRSCWSLHDCNRQRRGPHF